jgi:plasmid stabilization system protein ParE
MIAQKDCPPSTSTDMTRVQITTRALEDLEHLFDFLAEHNPKVARERMLSVRRTFELLWDHPLQGRQAEDGRSDP